MPDVSRFLKSWDNRLPMSRGSEYRTSEWGNINATGGVHTSFAPDAGPGDSTWPIIVEAGIRPLVVALTERIGAVTYDSCEGHLYPLELGVAPAVRRVGLLPRNSEEWSALVPFLLRAVSDVQRRSTSRTVELSVLRSRLWSLKKPSIVWEVIDLEFAPSLHASWESYFSDVDEVCALLVTALLREHEV